MKAFAIFAGGGVKGAALAGCLQSAIENEIEIQGYGGTSAGAIVALLANVGYTGTEIRDLLADEIHPLQLLENDGAEFKRAKQIGNSLASAGKGPINFLKACWLCLWNCLFIRRAIKNFGLDAGASLESKILDLVTQKIPELEGKEDITFGDLNSANLMPLKLVASDVSRRRAIVFSFENDPEQSVITAIRASSSYPGLFCPVKTKEQNSEERVLVDGGLASNLPAFLFADETEKNQMPTITFDLVSQVEKQPGTLFGFASAMLDTALEASDQIISSMVEGNLRVRVPVPSNISTLKFDLQDFDIHNLFNAGKAEADTEFSGWNRLKLAKQAGPIIQRELQAFYGDPQLFTPLLWGLARSIENNSAAQEIRCHIMLPTGRPSGSRIVVYHHGFTREDGRVDQDVDLELDEFGGCSGRANKERQPMLADLEAAEQNYETEWEMTEEQQRKIPEDRRSMLSVPIFANISANLNELPKGHIRGILSIDSSTPLLESGWLELDSDGNIEGVTERVTDLAIEYSRIISKVLR